jgi:putative alpha-1,2-mannosidase
MCNIIHDIRARTLKRTWHLTLQLAQSPKWTFEFSAIYFYIVLTKNWKYLVVWTNKQSFTGLGPEDRCSSYSWIPPFSLYWCNFTKSDLLTFIENI